MTLEVGGPEVGHAFVSLIPSLRGFSSATQRELTRSGIDRQAAIAGDRAGGRFSAGFGSRARVGLNRAGLFTGIATSARGLTPLLGLAAGAVGVFGLKTASSLQQARIAFTTMLGSAKQAKKFLGDLSTFAKNTPFDLPSVRTAAQKLLAFGFSAKRVLPTLTAIGDASAGLGLGAEGIDRITTAIGQIQAKGRVQSDELLQLTEAGVPALKILANQFGTTTAEMQAMVTKGLVPANKAIPALLSGLERGTRGAAGRTAQFAGLMDKQSRTLGGVISNLVDSVTQGLGKALLPLARILSRVIPSVTAAAGKGFALIADGIRASIPYVQRFGEFFTENIVPILRTVGGIMSRIISGLLPAFRDAWHSITSALGDSQGNLHAFGSVLSNIATKVLPVVVKVFGFWIRNLGRGIGFAIRVVGFLIDAFRAVKNFFTGPFLRAVGSMVKVVVSGFKFLLDVWGTVVGGIIHGAAAAFGWVPGVGGKLKGAADAFDAFKAHADAVFAGIAEDAGRWGTATGQNFAHGFGIFGKPFLDAISEAVGGIKLNDPGASGGVQNSAVGAFSTTGYDLGKVAADGVAKGLKDSSAKVSKSFSDLADKILGPLRDLMSKARDLAHSIADSITGSLGLGSLVSSTDSLGAQFTNSLHGILSGLAGQRNLVRKFRRQINQLENRGLSEAAIQQIVAMGAVDGSSFAATLLTASRRQLHRISRLTRGINRGGLAIGNDIAGDIYGPQIAHEVERTRRAIDKASKSTELGPKTMRRLERADRRLERRSKVYLDTGKLDRHNGREVLAL